MKALLPKLLLAALVALPGVCVAADYSGRIVGVVDGDTVDLLTDARELLRIRLSGIDAPEKRQPFSDVAKKSLSDLTFDRRVVVEGSKRDRWGRLVGKVVVSGVDANLQMVVRGLAWHYKKYEREQSPEDRRLYSESERKARALHIGLWTEKVPVAPWDFRATKRNGRAGFDVHGAPRRGQALQADEQDERRPQGPAKVFRGAELRTAE